MIEKAYISDLTWRSQKHQYDVIAQGLADAKEITYFIDGERDQMVRPTTRNSNQSVSMASLAVLSDNEKDLTAFVRKCKKRKIALWGIEDNFRWFPSGPVKMVVEAWRKARRNGTAKRGGEAKAEKSEKEFWEKFSMIALRWHGAEKSKALLGEAGIGHHDTVRVNLGYTRWEWRRLSDAKRARVLKGKINV